MAEQRYPWQDWDEQKHADMQRKIQLMDAIKTYRSAGKLGVFGKYAGDSNKLARDGGLSPDEATELARYKMFLETTGGDPAWQGPMRINAAERDAPETEDQIAERNRAYFATKSKDERAAIIAKADDLNARSRERFYDELVGPGPAPTKTAAVDEAEILRRSVGKPNRRKERT